MLHLFPLHCPAHQSDRTDRTSVKAIIIVDSIHSLKVILRVLTHIPQSLNQIFILRLPLTTKERVIIVFEPRIELILHSYCLIL